MRLPADQWVEILNNTRDEFDVNGASAFFTTWRVEEEDPLDIGDIEIADGMHARAGLLASLPKGEFILKLQFLREHAEGDWVLVDKFDPVRAERKKRQAIVEVSLDTKPGVLTGIDSAFYQKAYPVTAVAYCLYPIRAPDPANLAPLRDDDLNCVAQRVVEYLEGALRGDGLITTR